MNLGDRLVFSNGMLVLAAVAGLLIWVFRRQRQLADPPLRDRRLHGVHALAGRNGPLLEARARPALALPRARQRRGRVRDRRRAAVVIGTKFAEGAWIVMVAIPMLVVAMSTGSGATTGGIARRLRAGAAAVVAAPPPSNTTAAARRGDRRGDQRRRSGSRARSRRTTSAPIHVPTRGTRPGDQAPLVPVHRRALPPRGARPLARRHATPCSSRSGGSPRGESSFVTVVIPELFRRALAARGDQAPRELLLKLRLLAEPGVVVADVPVARGRARALCRAGGRAASSSQA